jgi:hypothetical protein
MGSGFAFKERIIALRVAFPWRPVLAIGWAFCL